MLRPSHILLKREFQPLLNDIRGMFAQACFREQSFVRLLDCVLTSNHWTIDEDLDELRHSTIVLLQEADAIINGTGPNSLGTCERAFEEIKRKVGLPYCEFGGMQKVIASRALLKVEQCCSRDNRFGPQFGEELASTGVHDLSTVLRDMCGVLLHAVEAIWGEELAFVIPTTGIGEGIDLVVVLGLRDMKRPTISTSRRRIYPPRGKPPASTAAKHLRLASHGV